MTNPFKDIRFIQSSSNFKSCPKTGMPEFAFIGRSNVGKSSLINMLAGIKNMAYISSKPGKTQLINHFSVDNNWCLVDLPGYGYAKTSKKNLESYSKLIRGYITTSEKLFCLFVLIDSRLEPQKIDLEFISFLGKNRIPFVLVFTKSDKIRINQLHTNIHLFKQALAPEWEPLPDIFVTSTVKKQGRDEIINFILKTLHA
jgi:GTP-binding protein